MSRKILVVDDTRNVQLMLQEYLQNQGFEICLAYDGAEAMEIFHAGGIDLILLDIMMPNMDAGPLVVAEVKRKSCHEESVFINWLHSAHQRPSSFSKYCLGLALLNPDLKRNRIKPNLLNLQKMQGVRYV